METAKGRMTNEEGKREEGNEKRQGKGQGERQGVGGGGEGARKKGLEERDGERVRESLYKLPRQGEQHIWKGRREGRGMRGRSTKGNGEIAKEPKKRTANHEQRGQGGGNGERREKRGQEEKARERRGRPRE